jgi:choice-of-anchor B domain-containing protein
MRKYCFAALLIVLSQGLAAQNNFNLKFLARWDDDSLPIASPNNLKLQYSSCWALAVKGREYAVVGGARHVLFFDVTRPTNPKLVGKFEGRSTVVPREFKAYQNRVYAVADGGKDGLMIFDLNNATDSITRTYWDTTYFRRIHTIALDTSSGRMYLNGGDAGDGIMVFDLKQNPDTPALLAHPIIPGGYVHDCYVRHDTVYASSGNDGLFVFDFKDPQNPKLLAQNGTGGYNHNSWLTLDGRYAYYAEEIPKGRPIHIVDLQLLPQGEIEIVGDFIDNLQEPDATVPKAIPHNVYVDGDKLFVSQYEDGLLVYDITNRTQPVLMAHYDTHPQNTEYNGFFGNWGNYPWLPSGTIVTSDMQNGLFLLHMGVAPPQSDVCAVVFPNPARDMIRIQSQGEEACTWVLYDATGKWMQEGQLAPDQEAHVYLYHVSHGCYFVKISTPGGFCHTEKVVVLNN